MILQMLADGVVHLSGVAKMAKHFTEDNHLDLLQKARGKTKTQVEALIAEAFPQPDVRPSLRKIRSGPTLPDAPAPAPQAPTLEHPGGPPLPSSPTPESAAALPSSPVAESAPPWPVKRPPQITPTSAQAYAVRFTATARGKQLLDRARDLLADGRADIGEILELGLEALVEKLEKKKRGKTDRPRPSKKEKAEPRPGHRYIPADVRRAVYERDGHRCTYVSPDGRRCSCTYGVQLDHIIPVALGGLSTVDNLRVRCPAHNMHAAEQIFGREKMDRHRSGKTSPGPGRVASGSEPERLEAEPGPEPPGAQCAGSPPRSLGGADPVRSAAPAAGRGSTPDSMGSAEHLAGQG